MVNAVAKEKNGIGYGGAAYAKGVKELKVVGQGRPGLRAERREREERASTRSSRPLFMYTRAKPAGEVKAFIDYCLSPEGQAIVTKVGYFPIK